MEFFEMLAALPIEQQAMVAAGAAWALTQVVKYFWKPAEEEKLQKLLTAVGLAGLMTLTAQIADFQGPWHFLSAWVLAALAATGFHELTSKVGLQRIVSFKKRPYNMDEAGGEG